MKKKLIITGIGLLLLMLVSLIAVNIWIGNQVKENISIVQKMYPGSAEEALIAFLQDEQNSAYDRTHNAVWTLGQIRSEKALPVLKGYLQNDPKGVTCQVNHDSMLCQYELHKAIYAIEKAWWLPPLQV